MAQGQQQWQGTERRQSQGSYTGEERRKANLPGLQEQPQDPKAEQQKRMQQQSRDDTH